MTRQEEIKLIDNIIDEIIDFTGGKAYTGTALTWREAGGFRINKCYESRIYLDKLTVEEARKLFDFLENRYGDFNLYTSDIYGVEGHDDDESHKEFWRYSGYMYSDLTTCGLIDNTKFTISLTEFESESYYIMKDYHFDSWLQFFEEGMNCGLDDPEYMDEEYIELYSGAYKSAVEYFTAHENDVQGAKIFAVIEKHRGREDDGYYFAVLPEESTYTELAGERYRLFIDIERLSDLELEKNRPEEDEEDDDEEY